MATDPEPSNLLFIFNLPRKQALQHFAGSLVSSFTDRSPSKIYKYNLEVVFNFNNLQIVF